jgi:flagellar export protein FliJ
VKRYAFSLDRVLKVRTAQEGLQRQALRAAASRASQADSDFEYVDRCYQASIAAEAATRSSVLAMLAMRDLDTMRARAVIEAEATREEANAALTDARESWVEAKRAVSALEELNTRQRADYDREAIAEQDAEADDIVTGRRNRPGQLKVRSPRDGGGA